MGGGLQHFFTILRIAILLIRNETVLARLLAGLWVQHPTHAIHEEAKAEGSREGFAGLKVPGMRAIVREPTRFVLQVPGEAQDPHETDEEVSRVDLPPMHLESD